MLFKGFLLEAIYTFQYSLRYNHNVYVNSFKFLVLMKLSTEKILRSIYITYIHCHVICCCILYIWSNIRQTGYEFFS